MCDQCHFISVPSSFDSRSCSCVFLDPDSRANQSCGTVASTICSQPEIPWWIIKSKATIRESRTDTILEAIDALADNSQLDDTPTINGWTGETSETFKTVATLNIFI